MRELSIVETGIVSGGSDKFEFPGFGTPQNGFISGAVVGAGVGMLVGSIPAMIAYGISYAIFGDERMDSSFAEPIAIGMFVGGVCGAPIGGMIGTIGYAAHTFY